MIFNSLSFLIFFPVVTTIYFLLPHRFRWLLLLSASVVFYMAFIPAYILILLFTIVVDFFAGRLIELARNRRRKIYLLLSIFANVGTLAFFKYYYFTSDTIHALANFLDWNYSLPALAIVLPIGLSFHTFQAMSYTIEVYRGRQKAERHFGIYALYVMFYPQLVAGPIERPQNLIHQFYEKHFFEYQRVVAGLKLMLWGFFKKIVIADRASILVDTIYRDPTRYPGIPLIVATVLFAIQIYCDFSGYSDIAIGSAKVMGINLMTNFNQPYLSRSIREFWSRWHISLSTWFRDYLYFPLGGSRVSKSRQYFNLLAVFLVSGLWHGANWTFVIWGALHGSYMIISKITAKSRQTFLRWIRFSSESRMLGFLQAVVTFSLVSFAWIFFRANTVSDALFIARNLFSGLWQKFIHPPQLIHSLPMFNKNEIFIVLTFIFFIEIIPWLRQSSRAYQALFSHRWFRWLAYYAAIGCLLIFGKFVKQNFIYFQF